MKYEPPIASRHIPDSLAFLDTVIALIDATDRDAWWEGPTFRSPCQTKHCVLSHVAEQLGMAAMDRFQNEWSTSYVIGVQINDKPSEQYPQAHPKDRVAAYLQNLRNGSEKDVQVSTYETFMHHEQQDAFAAAIHTAVCEASPEECAEENGACQKGARAVQNLLTASQPLDETRGTIINGLIDYREDRVLTAEQWDHLQRMAADPRFAELSRESLGVMKWPENPLLPHALFPATEPAKVATQSAGGDCFDVCEGHPVETPDAAGTPIRLTLGTDEITEPWSRTDFAVMSEVGDRVFEIDWDRGGVEEVLDCIVGGRLVTRDVHYGAWRLVDSPDPDFAPAEPAEEETKAEVGRDFVEIVFDGPPEAVSGRFVEVENPQGASISIGEWIDRGDGFWALRIPYAASPVVPAPTEASVIGGAAVALRAALAVVDPHEAGPWEHAWLSVRDLEDCAGRAEALATTDTEWPSLDAVPAHVRTVRDKVGDEYRRVKNGGWDFRSNEWQTIISPTADYDEFAPFVAVEEQKL